MAEELDPFTAEQLLRGESVDAPLSELLTAAAEPAYADELADEERVVAAFHSAQTRRPNRAFRLKAAIAVLAVAGTGAAAAAATGTLPALRGSQHGPSIQSGESIPTRQAAGGTGSQATPSSRSSSSQPSTQPLSPSKPPPSTTSSRPSKPPVSTPPRRPPATRHLPATAALVSLCRNYTSTGPRNDRSKDNPAFTVLITVAGGKERVRGYCERLLDQVKTHPQRSPLSGPPAALRAVRSATHRSGRPTAHPSNRPANPPAGDPAAIPTPRAR